MAGEYMTDEIFFEGDRKEQKEEREISIEVA